MSKAQGSAYTKICTVCERIRPIFLFKKHPQKCAECIKAKQRVSYRSEAMQKCITAAKYRYYKLIYSSKKRGIEVSITFEQYEELIKEPCFYCEQDTFGYETGGGLDRIDSSQGYSLDNVVPCCRFCNHIKRDYKPADLLQHLPKMIRGLKKLGDAA
jgi:hypothetical protein